MTAHVRVGPRRARLPTMGFEFARATTAAEIEAVQRLRYAVYVEEMHRYDDVMGAEEGRFAEPEDAQSWICYASDDTQVIAATRMTFGGDGFSERQIDQYQLAPFLADLPHEIMGVGERNTVLPAYRGTGVLEQLLAYAGTVTNVKDLQVVFGCCEPHLLSLYLKMGQRTYASRNINSPTAGYLIPLVSFLPDEHALRGVGPNTGPEDLPGCVQAVLARNPSARSQVVAAPDDYWGEIRSTLDELDAQKISTFDGFTEDQTKRCIARSTIIECAAGDRVLKRGGTARNIFVVLEGTLEVRDGATIVNVLTAGDAFGEIAFLLERPRSFDVDAATPTRVLSLSEGALRNMISDDATVAAKLLLNLSRMLCVRLIRAS
jgi:CRP-like cAMP-binding protein